MTCAVSAAVREGAEAIVCASTGNTAASAAAYAARAGLRCAVIVPEGKIATGKLAQALMHGARVIALRGNFDDALRLVRELASRHPIALVNSVNEFRIEGQKTAAFELAEDARRRARRAVHPGRQRRQHHRLLAWLHRESGSGRGCSASRPRGRRRSCSASRSSSPRPSPARSGSAIPARWEEAMDAMTASGGAVAAVTDAQILDAYRFLAEREGVFCEPASAASVAGLLAHGAGDARAGRLRADRPRPQGSADRARAGRRGRPVRARARRDRAGGARSDARRRRRLVRVPASSANLGPGFDVLAAALALHLEVEVEETGHVRGADRRSTSRATASNLVVRAFERLHPADGFEFRIESDDPAVAAGSARAPPRSWPGCWRPTTCSSSTPTCCALATELEGHPDNVAAALARRVRDLRRARASPLRAADGAGGRAGGAG